MDDEYAAFDRVVQVLIVAGLVLNLWIAWDWIKRDPENRAAFDRAKDLILGPLRRSRDIKKAERHVVFEAGQIVEEDMPWTGP